MEIVQSLGLRIAYLREGKGPPLVLLHGYVGDSRTWAPQLEGLSEEFTVVAWDAPGFGGSSEVPEAFTLSDYADCLAAFLVELGLDRAHVGGLSFGGGLALELYRRYPAVPQTLLLASAYAGWAGSLQPDEVDRRLQQALRLSGLSPEELVDELLPTMFTPSTPKEVVEEFGVMLREFRPSGFRTTARCFAESDLRDVLGGIEVPTLLLYGDSDVRAPLDVARDIHARVPGSKLVVIPGAGHICNLEAPERFNAEIREFLRVADR
jgi:pimeloyl-ACP methyl ester carboxylesterase